MTFWTKLPRATEQEYNAMTDNEKRVYLLQVKQEACAEWQAAHSAIVVVSCAISAAIGILYLFVQVVL